jgi:hypothetical protein
LQDGPGPVRKRIVTCLERLAIGTLRDGGVVGRAGERRSIAGRGLLDLAVPVGCAGTGISSEIICPAIRPGRRRDAESGGDQREAVTCSDNSALRRLRAPPS